MNIRPAFFTNASPATPDTLLRQACRDYRLQQEFMTLYTPDQNGVSEQFFRSLKEECIWQHVFQTLEDARRIIWDWLHWYNEGRPHSTLAEC